MSRWQGPGSAPLDCSRLRRPAPRLRWVADALEPRTFSVDLPAGDGLHSCRRAQLAAWVVDYGWPGRTDRWTASS